MPDEIVIVGSYPTASEADMAVLFLEQAGINARVYGSGRATANRGVEIVVHADDAERAREILQPRDQEKH
jgi:Putative prokaryotic signal transducing protein